jgi:hypothetical protein
MGFDILIFGMTVYKSLTTYWSATGQRLIDIVLRDGMYQLSLHYPSHASHCNLQVHLISRQLPGALHVCTPTKMFTQHHGPPTPIDYPYFPGKLGHNVHHLASSDA